MNLELTPMQASHLRIALDMRMDQIDRMVASWQKELSSEFCNTPTNTESLVQSYLKERSELSHVSAKLAIARGFNS